MKYPPIYVMSIPGSSRRETFSQRMEALNIPFTYWDAIDGRETPSWKFDEYSEVHAFTNGGRALKGAEVAVCLSIFALFEHCLKQGLDRVMIFEDDAVALPQFPAALKAVCDASVKEDILKFWTGQLSGTKPRLYRLLTRLSKAWARISGHGFESWIEYGPVVWHDGEYELRRPWRDLGSNVAYMITADGMRKILSHAYPITIPIDTYMARRYVHGVHQLFVCPQVVAMGVEGSSSTIWPRVGEIDPNGTKRRRRAQLLAPITRVVRVVRRAIYDGVRIYRYF